VAGVERTISAILGEAAATGSTPLAAADRLAQRRLAEAAGARE
jgi:hypothetical protein